MKNIISTETIIKNAAKATDGTESKMTIKDVKTAYNAIKAAVAAELGAGNKVQLTGFVTLAPCYRAEREANDISTNEKKKIPESIGVNAKGGQELKTAVKALTPIDFKGVKFEAPAKEEVAEEVVATEAKPAKGKGKKKADK